MKQCLYCSKPCSATAIFCDECQASLLKRQHLLGKLEQLSSSSLSEGREYAIPPTQLITPPVIPYAEDAVETIEEKPVPPVSSVSPGSSLLPVPGSRSTLPPPAPAQAPQRRRVSLPTRVRKALIVLVTVGAISFVAVGILLTAYAPQHHNVSPVGATASHGQTNTPVASPASGTSTPGTRGTATSAKSPGAGKPWLQLSSSHLAFQYTQGQANPAGQPVTISNGDRSAFSWQVNTGSAPTWLSVAPTQGNVSASGSGQLTVSVQVTQLTPGMYTGQLSIMATESAGVSVQNNPQTLAITLAVLAPCVLQATPAHLSFTATLLQQNTAGQTITLKTTGGCSQPVSWNATADASWVRFSTSSGSDNGAGSSLTVSTHTKSIVLVGTYPAHITLTALDKNGMTVQISPQTISVTLTISP